MALKFPINCVSIQDRTEYCYRAQEVLRLEHNVVGKWFREGITEAEYNTLSEKTKAVLPFKKQLTKVEWETFLAMIFEPMSSKITVDLLQNRDSLKNSTRFNLISIDDIQEVK